MNQVQVQDAIALNEFLNDPNVILNVQVDSGALFSITDEQFNDPDDDENLIFVSVDGTDNCGEIAKFKNAQLIGENLYKLTNFKRGLFATTIFADYHEKNDRFILLDEKIAKIPIVDKDFGKTKKFKIVTLGDDIQNGVDFSMFIRKPILYLMFATNPRVSKIEDKKLLIEWDFCRKNASFEIEIYDLSMNGVTKKIDNVSEKQVIYEFNGIFLVVFIYSLNNGKKDKSGLYLEIDCQNGEILKIDYFD